MGHVADNHLRAVSQRLGAGGRHVPGYIINETGKQLRERLFKAFAEDDLPAMKEFCDSFIRLDDIPLASPWFDTSGGRLQSDIKYSLSEKAKPVVELLRRLPRSRRNRRRTLSSLPASPCSASTRLPIKQRRRERRRAEILKRRRRRPASRTQRRQPGSRTLSNSSRAQPVS